jgi:hypothetical protein
VVHGDVITALSFNDGVDPSEESDAAQGVNEVAGGRIDVDPRKGRSVGGSKQDRRH